MLKLLHILLFIFCTSLYSYDAITLGSQNYKVHSASWNITEELIDPRELLDAKLTPFDTFAHSYGIDGRYFNYRFNLEINEQDTPIFLQNVSANKESCRLTRFTEDNQTWTLISQVNYSKKENIVLSTDVYQGIVILQCQSSYLRIIGFNINSESELKLFHMKEDIPFFMFTGLLIGLFLYNLFLLFIIRDKVYLYYIVNICLLYSINYLAHESLVFDEHIMLKLIHTLVILLILSTALFIDTYLNLKVHYIKLRKVLFLLMFFGLVIHIIEYFTPVVLLSPISTLIIMFYMLLLSIYTYYKGYKPALFLLIAIGGMLISILVSILISLGFLYHYSSLVNNLLLFGLSWDMVILSIALAYRIKTLEKEKKQAQDQLLLKAKLSNIGEITGNISHQWKEPLGGLGATLSSLKARLLYTQPSKDELLESIELSNEIVQHLGNTVDVFREFYITKKDEEYFDINVAIINSVKFVQEFYKKDKISIDYETKEECYIQGKSSEFSQVLLSIFHNAKEVIKERKISSAKIKIALSINQNIVELSICDNAKGITVEPIEDIFKANFSQKNNNSGMGLYIVKMIVEEKLHASIQASNTETGACFTFKGKVIKMKNL